MAKKHQTKKCMTCKQRKALRAFRSEASQRHYNCTTCRKKAAKKDAERKRADCRRYRQRKLVPCACGEMREHRAKVCKKCYLKSCSDHAPAYKPTPEEIKAMCEQFLRENPRKNAYDTSGNCYTIPVYTQSIIYPEARTA